MAGIGEAFRAAASAERQRLALSSRSLSLFCDADRPTIVLIEDIHWADDATLDFVRFLARRIRERSVLVLLPSRDEQDEGRRRRRGRAGLCP